MWLYQSGGHETACPIVLYGVSADRAGQHAVTFLQGFSGYLQVVALPGIMLWNRMIASWLAVWAHARRNLMKR